MARSQQQNQKEHKKHKGKKNAQPGKQKWGASYGIGFPYLLEGAGHYKGEGHTRHSVRFGYVDLPMRIKGADSAGVTMMKGEYAHRWQSPRQLYNRYYYGELGLGVQQMRFTGKKDVKISEGTSDGAVPVHAELSVLSAYWAPRVGLIPYQSKALEIGFGAGLQIPFYTKSSLDTEISGDPDLDSAVKGLSKYREFHNSIETSGEKFGKLAIPTLMFLEAVHWLD